MGAGALGCFSASILAKIGIGRIRVIDFDIVEDTNLCDVDIGEITDAMEKLVSWETKKERSKHLG